MIEPLPKLESLEAVVFDFDGVILESAAIKGDAFEKLFADRPEHADAIRTHHLENLGVSRFEKFEWIYRNIFELPLSEAESRKLGRRYSELVLEKTAASPFVPGALALLQALTGKLPLFVASATPQEELEEVVDRRGLQRYFASVHGSPPAKSELLRSIVRGRFTANRVLMVGDGVSDFRAAEDAGCRFVARIDVAAPEQPFPDRIARIHTLEELARWLA